MGSHVQVAADVHAHLLAVAGIGGVAVVIRSRGPILVEYRTLSIV